MTSDEDQINQLLEKLHELWKKQNEFSNDIRQLQIEINQLRAKNESEPKANELIQKIPVVDTPVSKPSVVIQAKNLTDANSPKQNFTQKAKAQMPGLPNILPDQERFIGENLISKIGIIITIIGVAIGAKYAIDRELISPLTRIILGYLFGIIMLVIAFMLKNKYNNFSAVLLSGSMAIIYFITYAAYDFYALIPQTLAFTLMIMFTAFTVIAAITYNKEVIAHIGLIGAYGVPFLLSEFSEKIFFLFTCMAIINVGILVVSIKKHWKSLYYSSYGLTWFIFFTWYAWDYQITTHFYVSLTFLAIFFLIFYLSLLIYKLTRKEMFEIDDVILLLANSFIFYGFGYSILSDHKISINFLGPFTLLNAAIHFMVSLVIYYRKLADRNLFYLVSGLVLVFITIAIPVQLEGHWVTMLWAGEAALLFWIGRTRHIAVYEKISYGIMMLAFFSIAHDWINLIDNYYDQNPADRILPFLNINFLTSVFFTGAFGFIIYIHQHKKYKSAITWEKQFSTIINFCILAIFLLTLYNTFRIEIATYWNHLFAVSAHTLKNSNNDLKDYIRNYDLILFKKIWIINYTLLFVSMLALINLSKIKSKQLGLINIGTLLLAIIIFLLAGLHILSELRESYLEKTLPQYYQKGFFHIGIRYISFALVVLTLYNLHRCLKQDFLSVRYQPIFHIILHTTILWICSNELINWLELASSSNAYKLGLSILWGLYSLLLISFGIWKKNKYLRIGAFALFGITLIKLFFYDIAHLNTISKTIVLVSLGVFLLIISFLYNKYKLVISDENEN